MSCPLHGRGGTQAGCGEGQGAGAETILTEQLGVQDPQPSLQRYSLGACDVPDNSQAWGDDELIGGRPVSALQELTFKCQSP